MQAKLVMLIVIWVDDVICADADSAVRQRFAADLGKKFPIEEKTDLTWVLGIKIKYDRGRPFFGHVSGTVGTQGHCHHTGDGWFAERKAVCKLSQADEAKMAHW